MIRSMTGFGQGTTQTDNLIYTITIKSLNSRYLDIKLYGIDSDPKLDLSIRNKIREKLKRGSIQINMDVSTNGNDTNNLEFNYHRFEQIDSILSSIEKKYRRQLSVSNLISSKDLFFNQADRNIEKSAVIDALVKAISQVELMRIQEGKKTSSQIELLLHESFELLQGLKEKVSEITKNKIEKYRKRISKLINGIEIEETRINLEIGILADKSDVTEELSRSLSHISQFKQLMQLTEPVGKRLNFLTQELNREINTLGVKIADADSSKDVINLKSKIEIIREQIQNIL